jgi:HSP20 family molecular chaperone IbpA
MEKYRTTQEYLSAITNRCRHMTAEEMMRNLGAELERNRLGLGHYLFDDRHPPFVEWTIPGAFETRYMKCEGGFEVVFTIGPFGRDEINVSVDDGMLEVTGTHVERDADLGISRSMKATKRIPLPADVDIEGITAKRSEGTLIVRIPQPRKGRREVSID